MKMKNKLVISLGIFVAMFFVGMQFDFSEQAFALYESLQHNTSQAAQIGGR